MRGKVSEAQVTPQPRSHANFNSNILPRNFFAERREIHFAQFPLHLFTGVTLTIQIVLQGVGGFGFEAVSKSCNRPMPRARRDFTVPIGTLRISAISLYE